MDIKKQKGLDVGYCNECGFKEDVYLITLDNGCEIRLCTNCLEELFYKILPFLKQNLRRLK